MKACIFLLVILFVSFSVSSPALAEGPTETAKQAFGEVTAVGFSDGSVAVTAGGATLKLAAIPLLGPVHSLAFRPDGRFLVIVFDQAYAFRDLTNMMAAYAPVMLADGCKILATNYDWLEKSQTAVFSLAVSCNGKVELQTNVWTPQDSKAVVLTLPDAR